MFTPSLINAQLFLITNRLGALLYDVFRHSLKNVAGFSCIFISLVFFFSSNAREKI